MQVYEEITPQEREEEIQKDVRVPIRKAGFSLVLLQAVICLFLLLAALVMKFMIPTLYEDLRAQYDAEMERSILITYDDISDT